MVRKILKDLVVFRIVHGKKFPSRCENGIVLPKERYITHFFLGPVKQNKNQKRNFVTGILDENNEFVWWSQITDDFALFLNLTKKRKSRKTKIELMKLQNDDLCVLYDIFHGDYSMVKKQLQPIKYRKPHPFRVDKDGKKMKGIKLSVQPIFFAFLATALFRNQMNKYECFYNSLGEEIKSKYCFHPRKLKDFIEFIGDGFA